MSDQTPFPDPHMTPEPLELDPFEMDWPWPGMVVEPAPEPARSDAIPPAATPPAELL